MADDRSPTSLGKVGTNVLLAAGAAGLTLVNPLLGAGAVGAVPAVQAGVEAAMDKVTAWRGARASAVLRNAAELAHVDPDELIGRVATDPDREQLLVRTLEAAADSPLREKLILLAVSLAAGTVSTDTPTIQWETQFVRALDDLDGPHVELLRIFQKTSKELFGEEASDRVPESLNSVQLDNVASHLPNLTSLLAVLERHGLVRTFSTSGGMSFSTGRGPANYEITDFGVAFQERLAAVGQYLAGAGDSTSSPVP